jgi:hypothetical protein
VSRWLAVLASRPEEHKKVDRETRTLYALADEVIRQHLTGKKTIRIYPLLLDETCWLASSRLMDRVRANCQGHQGWCRYKNKSRR